MINNKISFVSFLIFHACFINIQSLGNLNKYIQVIFAIWALFLLFKYTHLSYMKNFKNINIVIILYCITLIISSFYGILIDKHSFVKFIIPTSVKNLNQFTNPLVSVSYALSMISLFSFIEFLNTINKRKTIFKMFFYFSLFYCIINDILMFINHVDFSSVFDVYFLGNKFNVAYLHLFCVVMYLMQTKVNFKFYILLVYTILISYIIQSSTGILASLILGCFILFKSVFIKVMYNPVFVLLVMGIASSFFFVFVNFLDNPFVKYIIVDVLNEDLTLTGRTILYSYLGEIVTLSPIWGIGYYNSFSLMRYLYDFPNTQNGLITVWLEQGLIGCILFIYLLIQCLKYRRDYIGRLLSYPIMSLIILFIILSSIEITFGKEFIFILSFLLLIPNNNFKQINKRCQK